MRYFLIFLFILKLVTSKLTPEKFSEDQLLEINEKFGQDIEELKKNSEKYIVDPTNKRTIIILLGLTDQVLSNKATGLVSNNAAKWGSSLLLSAQILYGSYRMVNEIKDYIDLRNRHEKLDEVLEDTLGYVKSRQEKIDDCMKKINETYGKLFETDEGDKSINRLVRQFDKNVHDMILLIQECGRQLTRADVALKETEAELEKIDSMSIAELLLLYSGTTVSVGRMFAINTGFGIAGAAVAVVSLVGTVVANKGKENEKSEIKEAIATARKEIKVLRRTWEDNVIAVKGHIKFLNGYGFHVKDIPDWFVTPTP